MKPQLANILPPERASKAALWTIYCFLVPMLLTARLQQHRYQRKAVGGIAQTTFRSLRVATRSNFAFFLCSSTVVMAPSVLLARPSTTAAITAAAKPAIAHGPSCPADVAAVSGRAEASSWANRNCAERRCGKYTYDREVHSRLSEI